MGVELVSAQNLNVPGININSSQIFSGFFKAVPPELMEKINLLLDLVIIATIVTIIYFGLLILIRLFRFFFGTKEVKILKRIDANISALVGKRSLGKKIENTEEKKVISKKKKVKGKKR